MKSDRMRKTDRGERKQAGHEHIYTLSHTPALSFPPSSRGSPKRTVAVDREDAALSREVVTASDVEDGNAEADLHLDLDGATLDQVDVKGGETVHRHPHHGPLHTEEDEDEGKRNVMCKAEGESCKVAQSS